MEVKIFAVYDVKTATFGQPFFQQTSAAAQRSFISACRDKSSLLGQYPADFRLFHIGVYDDSTSFITSGKPELLMEGVNVDEA